MIVKSLLLSLFGVLILSVSPVLAEDAPVTPPTAAVPAPPLTVFPPDTHWAAVGDSITHGGWYPHFIHFYYLTRFPTQKLNFFNRGWNGAAAWQCIKRYPYDIAPLHATVASIMFGMNDGGRDFYVPEKAASFTEAVAILQARAIDSYETNLKKLVEKFQEDKTPVIIILPSIYDDTTQMTGAMANIPGYNAALGKMTERARKVAAELGVPTVDFYDTMQKINQAQQAADPKFTLVGMDRTHPGPAAHLVMAYCFLKAQNAPADVARFSIKGTDGTVASASNCQIDQVKVDGGKLSFQYLAKALPFPVQSWYNKALEYVPFTKDLDQEVFQVTDLPTGDYDIQIDGKTMQTSSASELAAGVNLSENAKTPQYAQAMAAWQVYQKQFDNYSKQRDLVTWEDQIADVTVARPLTMDQVNTILDAYAAAHPGKTAPHANELKEWKPKEAELQAQIDAALAQITTMVQPVAHQVTIAPAAKA